MLQNHFQITSLDFVLGGKMKIKYVLLRSFEWALGTKESRQENLQLSTFFNVSVNFKIVVFDVLIQFGQTFVDQNGVDHFDIFLI